MGLKKRLGRFLEKKNNPMDENYRFRGSDFRFGKRLKGIIDYEERVPIEDNSFKIQWRGSLLAFCHVVLPTLTAIGISFATTIYFEKENKIRESIISTMNLESAVMK